jgi:hypothetical protein
MEKNKEEHLRARAARQQEIITLLQEILTAIKGGAAPPPAPGSAITIVSPTLNDLQEMFESYGILKRANDLYVKTIDLSAANTSPSELPDLENALALTILTNTGTFTLTLQSNTDSRRITISPLTWPQTLLIDWLDIGKVWITNTAQPGLNTTIIKFFRG